MCDTSQGSNFSHLEEDVEPWDAPLRHRTTVSTHINTANLYQIGMRRDSVYSDINEDDGIIVNELYQRDPNIPIRVNFFFNF